MHFVPSRSKGGARPCGREIQWQPRGPNWRMPAYCEGTSGTIFTDHHNRGSWPQADYTMMTEVRALLARQAGRYSAP